jgi:hypothetical protein
LASGPGSCMAWPAKRMKLSGHAVGTPLVCRRRCGAPAAPESGHQHRVIGRGHHAALPVPYSAPGGRSRNPRRPQAAPAGQLGQRVQHALIHIENAGLFCHCQCFHRPKPMNVWPAPSASCVDILGLNSLRERIRPRSKLPGKMEIRAAQALKSARPRGPFTIPGCRAADRLSGHLCHHLPQTSWVQAIDIALALADLPVASGRRGGGLVTPPARQHRPCDTRELVC